MAQAGILLVPDWLCRQAAARPGHPALVAGAVCWSFETLDMHATRTARQLASLGVGKDSRVALLLRNGAPFVAFVHALARLGAVVVPLNLRLAPAELAWQLSDSGAGVLISEPPLSTLAGEAARGRGNLTRLVTGGPDGTGDLDGFLGAPGALLAAPEAPIVLRDTVNLSRVQGIIYTSATSGRPKGVLLTFGNHWWSAIGSALRLGLRDDDRWLVPLPLYHVGGLAVLWRSVIYGIPAVVHEAFDAEAINRDIDGGGITIISAVSTMLERVMSARGPRAFPSSLRCVLLGGGPASPALLAECQGRGLPVAMTYGLTEAASQVATLAPGEAVRKSGSCGLPLLPTEIRIESDGRPAAPEAVGEILVRGPTVTRGYAGRPEETARVLRQGWLRTGDLGYVDRDGYLYVVDRRDDLIVTGGENVYPAEVEAVLREHAAVADAGVIGLPDPVWGGTVAAVVARRDDARTSPEELAAFCAARLARYKVPRHVWFAKTLPRSPGGKLLRRTLREWAAGWAARERAGRPPAG